VSSGPGEARPFLRHGPRKLLDPRPRPAITFFSRRRDARRPREKRALSSDPRRRRRPLGDPGRPPSFLFCSGCRLRASSWDSVSSSRSEGFLTGQRHPPLLCRLSEGLWPRVKRPKAVLVGRQSFHRATDRELTFRASKSSGRLVSTPLGYPMGVVAEVNAKEVAPRTIERAAGGIGEKGKLQELAPGLTGGYGKRPPRDGVACRKVRKGKTKVPHSSARPRRPGRRRGGRTTDGPNASQEKRPALSIFVARRSTTYRPSARTSKTRDAALQGLR